MQALSVGQVIGVLRDVIEASDLFSDLWIEGEISNLTVSQRGHRYFSLKDDQSTLRCVQFRNSQPGMELSSGAGVLAHGRITIYEPRGDLQFIADFIRPVGVGLLAARFEEMRLRLEAEGLFALERKRPLPPVPRTIGVVTSPTGAALQDILNIVARRWPLARVIIAPTLVQGDDAPKMVAQALDTLGQVPELDVAIVARGGGSIEDLWAFNEEVVARAIFRCPVPVVSGVGHETDVTIADLVADLRAPTPSGAAELVTPDIREVLGLIAGAEERMRAAVAGSFQEYTHRASSLVSRVERSRPSVQRMQTATDRLLQRASHVFERRLDAARARLGTDLARIEALNPRATLARGYAIVEDADGQVVHSAAAATPGQRLQVHLADGSFGAEVAG